MHRDQVELVFARYQGEIRLFLSRQVGNPELAMDLTQETFARLLGADPTQAIGNVRAFLFRTAQRLAIDHHRKLRRQRTDNVGQEVLREVRDQRPSSEALLAGREDLRILKQALAELPVLTQRIFHLARVEGLGYAETARRLSISESSVQKHLARALSHAMARLRERGTGP